MSDPKTPEEALAAIKEAAEEGRVVFASDTVARTLDEYIQRIFREIRITSRGEPPKWPLWAADDCTVGFVLDNFGKSERDQEVLAAVSAKLGIPLSASDTWVDAGFRLRDHENAVRSADRH